MITCWESNRTNAAAIASDIPDQAIRLRILANSDSVQDQAVKRAVRDRVMALIDTWVAKPQSIEEARALIREHLPEIGDTIAAQLQESGAGYSYRAELGVVPFPVKVLGSRVYPSGDYEALRITLGSGQGHNWWCVLFPPLCFVDAVTGGAKAAKQPTPKAEAASAQPADAEDDAPQRVSLQIESKADIHFFVWDKMKQLSAKVRTWF